MRVTIINSFYAPNEVGGAEKSVRFIAEKLIQEGHQVQILCIGELSLTEYFNGVEVHRLAIRNLYNPLIPSPRSGFKKIIWHAIDSYNPFTTKQILEKLRSFSPDVVHTNTLSGLSVSVWKAVKQLNIPIVHTLRDYYLMCPNTAMFKDGQQCEKQCSECICLSVPKILCSNYVDTVVGNSEFTLQLHLKSGYFKNALSTVIYNAYLPEFKTTPLIKSDVMVFGFIGRLAKTKGITVLIDAFKELSHTNKNIRLLIAGEPESAEFLNVLKSKCEGLPVEFMGRVKPHEFYSKIHWCVIPSLWNEPLARVTFEAFAHGVPLIASRTGGTAELIKSGVNGFLYTATSVDELKNYLQVAIQQEPKELQLMQDACLENAKRFLPQNVLDSYIEVYYKAIQNYKNVI